MARKSREKRNRRAAKRRRQPPAAGAAEVAAWAAWPVSGAYMSYLDAFRICGQGLLFFCRKSKDGQFAFLLSTVDVFRGGLVDVAIVDTVSEGKFLSDFLGKSTQKAGYLMKPAAPEVVRRVFWGAYELMRQWGYTWPSGELARIKAFIPCPADGPTACLKELTRRGGLLEKRLLAIARLTQGAEDLPGDKEPLVVTTARFQVDDRDALVAWLRNAEPDVSETGLEEDGVHFNWTRAYPRGHWSPLAGLRGARQSLGDLVLSGSEIRVETKTASWAARFAQLLHEKLGADARLAAVEWQSWQEMMRSLGSED